MSILGSAVMGTNYYGVRYRIQALPQRIVHNPINDVSTKTLNAEKHTNSALNRSSVR